MASAQKIYIVGIGDDGLDGLTSSARKLIASTELLIGDAETLQLVSSVDAERCPVGVDLDVAVERIEKSPDKRTAILAAGDPLFYGVARYLCDRLGKDRFEVVPHVSTMQLAFARVKESWDEAYLTDLANRDLAHVVEKIRVADTAGLFTTEELTPAKVAQALLDRGVDYFSAYVCENLGSPDECVTQGELSDIANQEFPALNVMILVRQPDVPDRPREQAGRRLFGNPDDAFLQSTPKQGLLTPAEIRCLALSELDIGPRSIVWDIGAGSGSVAVEAAQIAHAGTTYAIEMDQEDADLIRANAERFGVANLSPVFGKAPEAWKELPKPDCVFVGGAGREVTRLAELAFAELKPGGRLAVCVGSVENLAAIHQVLHAQSGDAKVWMVNVARGAYQLERLRFAALNPTFLLSAVKPA